jgi:hypothetical protein
MSAAQVTVTGDGPHTLVYRTIDVAGRASADVTTTFKIDASAPSVTLTRPAATTYTLNQSVTASCVCSDALSVLASCTGTVPAGQPIDTAGLGAKSFAVQATDNAGNVTNAPVTYQVGYAVCALYDQSKAHKWGSTIPVKLQLCDVNGTNTSSPGVTLNSVGLVKIDNTASTTVDTTTSATADRDFRYDAGLGGYIYNLKTTGLTTGTWQLNFTTSGDGVPHSVRFDIR